MSYHSLSEKRNRVCLVILSIPSQYRYSTITMISLSSVAVCLGIFILIYVIRVERNLSGIPGPFLARFTDYWKVYHLVKGDYGETIGRWHQMHGDLIRTGPRHVSVGDPYEVPNIYRTSPLLHKACI